MAVKEILDEFARNETQGERRRRDGEATTQAEVEERLRRITRCFQELILPAVLSTESDLQQAGFWHKVSIGQSTSRESGATHVRDLSFHFYPERAVTPDFTTKTLEKAYKASVVSSGDLRKITFTLRFPKRLPPVVELDETVLTVEEIDRRAVDAFLEKFIKGAIDAWRSDRVLR